MKEGKLDGIANPVDLSVQATDVGEGDIRYLLQDQVILILLGDQRQGQLSRGVDHDLVSHTQVGIHQGT